MTKEAKAAQSKPSEHDANAALFLEAGYIISFLRQHAHCSHSHTTHPEKKKKLKQNAVHTNRFLATEFDDLELEAIFTVG